MFSCLNLYDPTVCLTHNTDAGSGGREQEEGEDTGFSSFLTRGNLRSYIICRSVAVLKGNLQKKEFILA